MGKDNTALLIGAGLLGAYLLMPRRVNEGGGSPAGGVTTLNLGLGGENIPSLSGFDLSGLLSLLKIPAIPEIPAIIPAIPAIPDIIPEIPDKLPIPDVQKLLDLLSLPQLGIDLSVPFLGGVNPQAWLKDIIPEGVIPEVDLSVPFLGGLTGVVEGFVPSGVKETYMEEKAEYESNFWKGITGFLEGFGWIAGGWQTDKQPSAKFLIPEPKLLTDYAESVTPRIAESQTYTEPTPSPEPTPKPEGLTAEQTAMARYYQAKAEPIETRQEQPMGAPALW